MSEADRDYRALLEQCESDATSAYDTTAVTLSGGALAIALAFVKDVPDARWRLLFPLALLALTISVLSVLVSLIASMKSMRYEIECVDGKRHKPKGEKSGGPWRTRTEFLNWTTLGGCVFGIVLLATFCGREYVEACTDGKAGNGYRAAASSRKRNPARTRYARSTTGDPGVNNDNPGATEGRVMGKKKGAARKKRGIRRARKGARRGSLDGLFTPSRVAHGRITPDRPPRRGSRS